MSTKIESTSLSQSILTMTHSYLTLNEKDFFDQFGWNKAKMVATDKDDYADYSTKFQSITSFEIGDCITVFALEKGHNNDKAIYCWHIGDDSSVKDIEDAMVGRYQDQYEIYIVGGNDSTTKGSGCLLKNIKKAIQNTFGNKYNIQLELINLVETLKTNYVSANLQLDGTLTICYHD